MKIWFYFLSTLAKVKWYVKVYYDVHLKVQYWIYTIIRGGPISSSLKLIFFFSIVLMTCCIDSSMLQTAGPCYSHSRLLPRCRRSERKKCEAQVVCLSLITAHCYQVQKSVVLKYEDMLSRRFHAGTPDSGVYHTPAALNSCFFAGKSRKTHLCLLLNKQK